MKTLMLTIAIIFSAVLSGCSTGAVGRGGFATLPFKKGDLAELMAQDKPFLMRASANSVPGERLDTRELEAPLTKGEFLLSQSGGGNWISEAIGQTGNYLQKPTQGEVTLVQADSDDLVKIAMALNGIAWAEPGAQVTESRIFLYTPENSEPVAPPVFVAPGGGTVDHANPTGDVVQVSTANNNEAEFLIVDGENRFYAPRCRTWAMYRLRDPDGPRKQTGFKIDADGRQYVAMRDGGQLINLYVTNREESGTGIIVFDVRRGPGAYRAVAEDGATACP